MNPEKWLIVAAALTFVAGCAQTDWIDRTLVTVDVTGTWSGGVSSGRGGPGGPGDLSIELKQEGSTVKGSLQTNVREGTGNISGSIEGTVAGDVFRFRNARGSIEGEMTVKGDEMTGLMSTQSASNPVSLRRVDPSSRPGSPPR